MEKIKKNKNGFKIYYGKEDDLQISAARHLDSLGVLWNHCANERKTETKVGRKGKLYNPLGSLLKRKGVKAGYPDVAIYEPRGEYHGLFIELKSEKGRITEEQAHWIRMLKVRGYKVHTTNSLDEFLHIVDEYLKIK